MHKLLSAASLLAVFVANAVTADELLKSNMAPADLGLAIAKEGDRRDTGFGDSQSTMKMVLRNAQGEEATRNMSFKTLEIPNENSGDKSLMVFDSPRDIKGTALLTFTKILEPDDQWLFLPALKRVKRIASNNKSGSFVGSEFAYEDLASQEVAKYSYKYIEQTSCRNLQGECFKVERTPLYANSGYSKQIVLADTAEFRIDSVDFYDRKNSLFKRLDMKDYKQYLGQYWRAHRMVMNNLQTGKSTTLLWDNYNFRTGLTDSDFTKDKLKRVRG